MKILYINSCVRKESRTNILAKYALDKLNCDFEEVVLNNENIVPLKTISLNNRDKFIAQGIYDDDMFKYAKQFSLADIILVSAPYWDLSFPSLLKTYFELVNVVGITFKYSNEGVPISLCKAKQLIYITTAGGQIFSDEFGYGYIKTISESFYGIKKFDYIKSQNLDVIGADIRSILEQAKKEIDKIKI